MGVGNYAGSKKPRAGIMELESAITKPQWEWGALSTKAAYLILPEPGERPGDAREKIQPSSGDRQHPVGGSLHLLGLPVPRRSASLK